MESLYSFQSPTNRLEAAVQARKRAEQAVWDAEQNLERQRQRGEQLMEEAQKARRSAEEAEYDAEQNVKKAKKKADELIEKAKLELEFARMKERDAVARIREVEESSEERVRSALELIVDTEDAARRAKERDEEMQRAYLQWLRDAEESVRLAERAEDLIRDQIREVENRGGKSDDLWEEFYRAQEFTRTLDKAKQKGEEEGKQALRQIQDYFAEIDQITRAARNDLERCREDNRQLSTEAERARERARERIKERERTLEKAKEEATDLKKRAELALERAKERVELKERARNKLLVGDGGEDDFVFAMNIIDPIGLITGFWDAIEGTTKIEAAAVEQLARAKAQLRATEEAEQEAREELRRAEERGEGH